MNITDNFFKDVYLLEQGYLGEELLNDDLMNLDTNHPDFWQQFTEIVSKKDYPDLYYMSVKYVMKDDILSEREYQFIKKMKEILGVNKVVLYEKHKSAINRLVFEVFYLMYLDDIFDEYEEQEMHYLTDILGVDYRTMNQIKQDVLSGKGITEEE